MSSAELSSEPEVKVKPQGGRFRAVVIGFLLTIPVTYCSVEAEISSIFSLIVAPISALLLCVLFNAVARKFAKKWELTTADLIIIYTVVSIAGAVSSEWIRSFHSLIHTYPFQSESNPMVRDVITPNVPDFMAIKDKALVNDIQGGGRGLDYVFTKLPVMIKPYLGWGILFFAVCFAMLCVNSLMRGMWTKQERLTFPLIQLPIAMTEENGRGAMWRSRHMWAAFMIMFGIDMLNGFQFLYPNLPSLPVKDILDIRALFPDPPLSNMGMLPLAIYPFMAAVGLLMPKDLLISIIFFFFVRKITHVTLAANGIPQDTFSGTANTPGPPYFDEQTWGGVIALFLTAMWMARGYLRQVWSEIKSGVEADDDGVKHRWAFIGLAMCFLVVMIYGSIGGMPFYYTFVYFALFLIFSVVLSRIRAALGPPTHEFAYFGPNSFMGRFFGTSWLSEKAIVTMNNMFIFINRLHRTHPMPLQLEAMKMGQMYNISQKKIFKMVILGTVAGFFLAMIFYHGYTYRSGDPNRWTDAIYYTQNMLNGRKGPDLLGISMTFLGFSVVVLLDAIRMRFVGFPLHPVGYVLSMNFGVDYYWFGLLVALGVKTFVQNYYGLKGFEKLRNVALGIILGEYAAETIWIIVSLITRQATYTISFNERGFTGQ